MNRKELDKLPAREKEILIRRARETVHLHQSIMSLPAQAWSIGHVLRLAAGLPDREDPIIGYSDGEVHLPNVGQVVARMFLATLDSWPNPRAAEAELVAIRRDLDRLIYRIVSLSQFTWTKIDSAGDPGREEFEAAQRSGDSDRIRSAISAMGDTPYEHLTVPSALRAMEMLDEAIVLVIEQTTEASVGLKTRTPNLAKNEVALLVAQYLHDVTGNIPGLTTRPVVTGPFALALQKIFEILSLPTGVQRPGEYAVSTLTSKLSKKLSFDT